MDFSFFIYFAIIAKVNKMRAWFSGRTRPCQGRDGVSITPTRTKSVKIIILFCAPGGTRTPNNCFEGRHDIHFTTGACFYNTTKINLLPII